MRPGVLRVNLLRDAKALMLSSMKSAGYTVSDKLSPDDIFRQYFQVRIRDIEPRPRDVKFSKTLKEKLAGGTTLPGLELFIEASHTGSDLNCFKSLQLPNPDWNDALLFDWRIQHFHLSATRLKSDPRFMDRTGPLLYAIVKSDTIYAIDLLDHEAFTDVKLVQVVHDNWPEILVNGKLNLPIEGTNPSSSEIVAKCRQVNATTPVVMKDGTVYASMGGGYMSSGTSFWAVRLSDQLSQILKSLEEGIMADEASVRAQIRSAIGRCPPDIEIRMESWSDTEVLAFEKKTKTKLRFEITK